MRRWIVLAVAAMVAAAVPAAVLATTTGAGDGATNCQSFASTTAAVSTSSSAWQDVPGLTRSVTSHAGMVVTVSVRATGAPFGLQVTDDSVAGVAIAPPGPAFFAPPSGSGTTSFSFTWSDPGITAAMHGHTITVQWRRTSSTGTTTLHAGDVAVLYETTPGSCPA